VDIRQSMQTSDVSEFAPRLRVHEVGGLVRLTLEGVCSAEGPSLQEAADELVWKVLMAVIAFRSAGMGGFSTLCRPKLELVRFLWELSEIAAAGGDIRERLFGPSSLDLAA
jgi:hypothetical protein